VTILLVVAPWRASAQRPAPDVLVLVQPGRSATLVSATFARQVPHAEVRDKLRTLAAAGRWDLSGLNIKDVDPRTGEAPRGNNAAQTEATAWLVGGPIYTDGAFWLQPLVEAFAGFGRLDLLFMVPADSTFRGLRHFAADGFRLDLIQEGGPYRYSIEAGGASIPKLPLHETRDQTAAGQELQAPQRRVNPYALVLLAASLAAVATFAVLFAWGRARREHADGHRGRKRSE